MSGPLSGVKVVEMSTYVAGPVTARLLADLGAEVIKVEAPIGDHWRRSGISYVPSRFEEDENPVFDIYNTGKKLVSLNLKSPEGKEAFLKLIEEADVFVTNTRSAGLKRLGISYEDLKEKYPKLIYAMVLGFGEKGPDAAMPAFDTTAFWSRSGFFRDMAVKTENYYPVAQPSSVGDTATAFLLVAEICAALYRRTSQGTGEFVSSTLYRNGIFCMGTMIMIAQPPFGNNYPNRRVDWGVPGGSYECADGEWIYLNIGTKPYESHYQVIDRMDLLSESRFIDGPTRWKNREELYEIFREAFLQKTSDEWLKICKDLDLPVVRMNHFKDVSSDPQAWENGFLEHVTFRNGHVDVMPTSPIEMASANPAPTKPAEGIGADTAQVLRSLGYSDEQVSAMINAGAAVGPKK